MKRELCLPKDATFVSLKTIATNVQGVHHATIESLPERVCVFASEHGLVTISYEDERISFPKDGIKRFDIVPVTSGGVTFYAATIEFYANGDSLRYGIVVSPEMELCWLRTSAEQIGAVPSIPPLDLTQTSQ